MSTKPVPLPTLCERLAERYPDARYELDFKTPLQLLIATILAAQCTDERVNQVTPKLFAAHPDARSLAEAPQEAVEELVRPTGFYRNKATAIRTMCQALVRDHGGEVPADMNAMTRLPGVARKTANVVLTQAFGQPSGIIVDSHCHRVSGRMGLSSAKNPDMTERDLMAKVPRDQWIRFGPAMVLHGRYTCTNTKPDCENCFVTDLCPRIGVPAVSESEKKPAAKKGAAAKKSAPPKDVDTPIASAAIDARRMADALPATGGDYSALPPDWAKALAAEVSAPYYAELQKFVAKEREGHEVYPPANEVFAAFHLCPFDKVKVVLLGQDPYPNAGEAHGLCFSVKESVKFPASLRNMLKEMETDQKLPTRKSGDLSGWARQGVLLLNTFLTVRAKEIASHEDAGWKKFTDAVIRAVSAKPEPVAFALWGKKAEAKVKLIDSGRHGILLNAHPSPLSAAKFFGSKPYSRINAWLTEHGYEPIDWSK